MESATIFYSWQSDLPNRTNRGLIQDALEKAAYSLKARGTLSVEPVVDRDTQGLPGSPDIGQAIFEKIRTSSAFVCDISLINGGQQGFRPVPNPNVLIELGFALSVLGWERIVLVFNEAFGSIQDLPFDLRQKRALTYRSAESEAERAPARNALQAKLADALELVLQQAVSPPELRPRSERAIEALRRGDPDAVALVGDFMDEVAERIAASIPKPTNGRQYEDLVHEAITASTSLVLEFTTVAEALARRRHKDGALKLVGGFGPLLQLALPPAGQGHVTLVASFDLPKFLGYELFTSFVAVLLKHECMDVLGGVLQERLTVDTADGCTSEPLSRLSRDLPGLRAYFKTLGQNPISPHAEVLKARHDAEGPLASACPWKLLVDADFLLYLRYVDDGDQSTGTWVPWSFPYLQKLGTPAWLVRAESRRALAALCEAFGGISVEAFKRLYSTHALQAGKLLPDYVWWPPALPEADTLGKRP